MSAPWIELDNVHLDRGGRPVLQGITANLSGRAIGLVGANGSGKSTLIGALLGVLRAHTGSIKILGRPIPEEAMEVRARAGVMAEQAGVFPGGSGVDAVTFAGTLSGLPRRERETCHATIEGGEALLEDVDGRVHDAGIDVPELG